MKVAIVLGPVTGRGGMETVISSVVNEYNNRLEGDMKVFLLGGSEDTTWLNKINSKSYHFISLSEDSKFNRYLKCLVDAPAVLKDYNPDIILAADEKSVLYSKAISKFLRKKPKVGSWIHFSLTSIKSIYRKIIKTADFHLAISEGIKNEFGEFNLSRSSKVHLIYNPIQTNNNFIERPTGHSHFIYVGRLIYDGQKRVNDLLESLSKVEGDWKLTVIGDGKDKLKLVDMARELKINHKISWLGWQESPWDNINEASALLLTSEYEGFPMVLLEAMSRGIPCISSDCPVGPSNIIQHDYNGWLYPIGELSKLSNILNQVVVDHNSLPSQLKVQKSIERFDTKLFIENLRNVFEIETRV